MANNKQELLTKSSIRFRRIWRYVKFFAALIAVVCILQIICYVGDRFIFGIAPIDSGILFDNQGGGLGGGRGGNSGLINDSPTGAIILVCGIIYLIYRYICRKGSRYRRGRAE